MRMTAVIELSPVRSFVDLSRAGLGWESLGGRAVYRRMIGMPAVEAIIQLI